MMRFAAKRGCVRIPSVLLMKPHIERPLRFGSCQEERERREAKEKRKQENKERGFQYQVITNTSKIKKMSKKQLRQIKKADTTGVAPKVYGSS